MDDNDAPHAHPSSYRSGGGQHNRDTTTTTSSSSSSSNGSSGGNFPRSHHDTGNTGGNATTVTTTDSSNNTSTPTSPAADHHSQEQQQQQQQQQHHHRKYGAEAALIAVSAAAFGSIAAYVREYGTPYQKHHCHVIIDLLLRLKQREHRYRTMKKRKQNKLNMKKRLNMEKQRRGCDIAAAAGGGSTAGGGGNDDNDNNDDNDDNDKNDENNDNNNNNDNDNTASDGDGNDNKIIKPDWAKLRQGLYDLAGYFLWRHAAQHFRVVVAPKMRIPITLQDQALRVAEEEQRKEEEDGALSASAGGEHFPKRQERLEKEEEEEDYDHDKHVEKDAEKEKDDEEQERDEEILAWKGWDYYLIDDTGEKQTDADETVGHDEDEERGKTTEKGVERRDGANPEAVPLDHHPAATPRREETSIPAPSSTSGASSPPSSPPTRKSSRLRRRLKTLSQGPYISFADYYFEGKDVYFDEERKESLRLSDVLKGNINEIPHRGGKKHKKADEDDSDVSVVVIDDEEEDDVVDDDDYDDDDGGNSGNQIKRHGQTKSHKRKRTIGTEEHDKHHAGEYNPSLQSARASPVHHHHHHRRRQRRSSGAGSKPHTSVYNGVYRRRYPEDDDVVITTAGEYSEEAGATENKKSAGSTKDKNTTETALEASGSTARGGGGGGSGSTARHRHRRPHPFPRRNSHGRGAHHTAPTHPWSAQVPMRGTHGKTHLFVGKYETEREAAYAVDLMQSFVCPENATLRPQERKRFNISTPEECELFWRLTLQELERRMNMTTEKKKKRKKKQKKEANLIAGEYFEGGDGGNRGGVHDDVDEGGDEDDGVDTDGGGKGDTSFDIDEISGLRTADSIDVRYRPFLRKIVHQAVKEWKIRNERGDGASTGRNRGAGIHTVEGEDKLVGAGEDSNLKGKSDTGGGDGNDDSKTEGKAIHERRFEDDSDVFVIDENDDGLGIPVPQSQEQDETLENARGEEYEIPE